MTIATTRDDVLRVLRERLPDLRTRFGVAEIAVYGSFARGTQTPKSDVDLIVRLARPLGLEFISLTEYLEDLLGRPVDLATFDTLQRSKADPRRRRAADEIERTLDYV